MDQLIAKEIIPDKSINFQDINPINFLYGLFNLMFVGTDIADEDEGVVVFNLFHGGFSVEREFEYFQGIETRS